MNKLRCEMGLLSLVINIASLWAQIPNGGMEGVEEIKFKSIINNQDYVLFIKLPDSYVSDTARKYPVVYVTDGQWVFPLMMEIRGGLLYDNLAPEIIFVGISWPDNFFVNRIRDFFPAGTDQFPEAVGPEKFLNVIKHEIMKKIDSTYRTDKVNNTLYGISAGGFFVLYTLFHEPALFNGYIACSPSLWYNDEVAFKYEKAYSEKVHTLNAKLFLSSGGYEEQLDPTTFTKFNDQMKSSNYTGLQTETLVIEKMGHLSANPYAIGRGLEFIFSYTENNEDTNLLDKYAGKYEMDLTFSRLENSLYSIRGGRKFKLSRASNTNFYLPGVNGSIEFIEDDKGKVIGFRFNSADQNFFVKKLE